MGIVDKNQALLLATGMEGVGKMPLASDFSVSQEAFMKIMVHYKAFLDKLKEVNEGMNAELAALRQKVGEATTDEERQKLEASIGVLEVMRSKSIPEITAEMNKASLDWNKLFSAVGTFTGEVVDEGVKELQEKIDELKEAGKLTQESYASISKALLPEEEQESYYKTFGEQITALFNKVVDGSKSTKISWKDFGESSAKVLGDVSTAMNGIGNVGKALGMAPETLTTFSQVSSAIGGAANLAKGIASGDVTSIISGGTQMISSVISLFDFSTKRADRKIKQHASNIKALQRDYETLGWQVKNALGSDKYVFQINEAENKAKQIQEIEGQIAAEQSKRRKKRDNEKIKEYQAQKVKLEHEIQDIQKSIVEDLMTTDVKSLASRIATAIVEGVAAGVNDLDKVVDGKMDQLMRDILKRQFEVNVVQVALKPMFDNAAKYFDKDSAAGFGLSDVELENLLADAENGKTEIMKGVDGYKKLLKVLAGEDEFALPTTGVTGQLQEAMTEGTASQLVGLWNMTANDIRMMKNLTSEQLALCSAMNLNVGEVLRQQYLIEMNTRRTADNTAGTVEELKSGFLRLDGRLKTIDENTRGYTGRGK